MFTKTMTGERRLSAWRQYRDNFPADGKLEDVLEEFANTKTLSRYLDYYSPDSWPNVFDIVNEGYICQSGLTLIMVATLHNLGFINSETLHLEAISNFDTGKDGLVFTQGGMYYNFLPGELVTEQHVKDNSTTFQKFIITTDKLYS